MNVEAKVAVMIESSDHPKARKVGEEVELTFGPSVRVSLEAGDVGRWLGELTEVVTHPSEPAQGFTSPQTER